MIHGYMIQRCCTPAYQHTASWSLITSVRYCVDCIACRSRDEWSLTLRVWHTNRLYSLRQQHRRRPTYLSAYIQLVYEHGRRHLRSSSYRTLLLNLLTYLLTHLSLCVCQRSLTIIDYQSWIFNSFATTNVFVVGTSLPLLYQYRGTVP